MHTSITTIGRHTTSTLTVYDLHRSIAYSNTCRFHQYFSVPLPPQGTVLGAPELLGDKKRTTGPGRPTLQHIQSAAATDAWRWRTIDFFTTFFLEGHGNVIQTVCWWHPRLDGRSPRKNQWGRVIWAHLRFLKWKFGVAICSAHGPKGLARKYFRIATFNAETLSLKI